MRCLPGQRILEVGVGTGLSLPLYPRHACVTGIDVSPEMLERARGRVARHHLNQVEALQCTDGEYLPFPDGTFDKVVAMYVVSVTPDPIRLVAEMSRVCKPGGEIYVLNHFSNVNPVVGGFEKLLAPFSSLMGFHPDVALRDFVRDTGLKVEEQAPVNLFGYWTLLCARNPSARLDPQPRRAVAV
jgi:phosphatidylethanolamine/phosphatidyl-N-methylethanolamine N-methyltransferase